MPPRPSSHSPTSSLRSWMAAAYGNSLLPVATCGRPHLPSGRHGVAGRGVLGDFVALLLVSHRSVVDTWLVNQAARLTSMSLQVPVCCALIDHRSGQLQ